MRGSDDKPQREALYTIVVALLVLIVIVMAVVFLNKPDKGASTEPLHGQWVVANLSSGEHYYGHLVYREDLGAYVLWNVWRQAASSQTSQEPTGTVMFDRTGDELYKPEPYIVINPQSLLTWQGIADPSEVLTAIRSMKGYTEVAEPKTSDIEKGSLSAVFLSDSTVLFGTLVHKDTMLGVKNAYLITRKNQAAGNDQPIGSLSDLQLIPQRNLTPGSEDTLWVNPGALVMYETLTGQSPVAQAIKNR